MSNKKQQQEATFSARRHFLSSSAALMVAAAFTPSIAWADSALLSKEQRQFSQLAHFLTGQSALSDVVIQRGFEALTAQDSAFLSHSAMAWQKIQQANLTSVDELNEHSLMQDDAFAQTVKRVVSAFYLGYTGTPISQRAKDNTRFVTYTDALMYQPTLDATVIPSYSRARTNYWVNPPASIDND
ncbi:sugar dehydrogenase complex small subunit [Vibrio olivae]|uniref:Sugar dehydrogenase complex small subunit n=1 Tax=Vibrio olivae TaxID=1243002 RepID=A0ABV5HIF5_9VIBR